MGEKVGTVIMSIFSFVFGFAFAFAWGWLYTLIEIAAIPFLMAVTGLFFVALTAGI